MTQAEAAEVLGVSAKTVQRRLNRAPAASGGATGRPPARRRVDRANRSDACPARCGRSACRGQARDGAGRIPRWPAIRGCEQLLEEILDSRAHSGGGLPACPELLPEVRGRLRQTARARGRARLRCSRRRDHADGDPSRAAGRPIRRRSRAMRWRRCSAAAAWASSTRPGTCASTASSPSRCCIAGAYAGPHERARFQREAEAVASLRHAEHRAGLRRGRPRGLPVLHDGAPRGGQPGPGPGGHAAAGPPGGRARWPRWPRPCRRRTRAGSCTAT